MKMQQVREKIGVMFGNPETTTGGNALKFYASVRIEIRPSTFIKDGDQTIGRLAKVKVVKNKVAPPFMKAEFEILFGEGISRAGEIIDLATEHGIVKKSGAWFSYNGTKLGQGRDAVKKVIADNPELADELSEKILAVLRGEKHEAASAPFPPIPSKGGKSAKAAVADAEEDIPGVPDDREDLFGDDFEVEMDD